MKVKKKTRLIFCILVITLSCKSKSKKERTVYQYVIEADEFDRYLKEVENEVRFVKENIEDSLTLNYYTFRNNKIGLIKKLRKEVVIEKGFLVHDTASNYYYYYDSLGNIEEAQSFIFEAKLNKLNLGEFKLFNESKRCEEIIFEEKDTIYSDFSEVLALNFNSKSIFSSSHSTIQLVHYDEYGTKLLSESFNSKKEKDFIETKIKSYGSIVLYFQIKDDETKKVRKIRRLFSILPKKYQNKKFLWNS